jgi:hypothetical protein
LDMNVVGGCQKRTLVELRSVENIAKR